MLHSQSSRLGSILLLIAAVIGFGVALWAWLTPLTGVTGTIGALGVAIASVVLALLTLLLRGSSGGARVSGSL